MTSAPRSVRAFLCSTSGSHSDNGSISGSGFPFSALAATPGVLAAHAATATRLEAKEIVSDRIVVWGTCVVAKSVLRELLDHPRREVAAVSVDHAEKDGKDLAEILGGEDTGIRATRDSTADLPSNRMPPLGASRVDWS